MASSAVDLLDCSVCLSTLTNPHLIPRCGHTFCLGCIQSLRDAQCPLCRQRFDQHQVSPNFVIQHLVDSCARPSAPLFSNLPNEASESETGEALAAAAGSVMGAPFLRRQPTCTNDVVNAYRSLEVPQALATALAEEDAEIALRIYLLDNSGSMNQGDGGSLVRGSNGHLKKQACTRWQELQELSAMHAAWNRTLGMPCEFVLLNSPSPANPVDGRDLFRIDAQMGNALMQESSMKSALGKLRPSGSTPLGKRVSDIHTRLKRNYNNLLQSGRKVMLTIVTDGVPDSRPDLVDAIRRLMLEMPVRITFRMCTDESKVVEFYNDLDKDVEMPLDILDDFAGEVSELNKYNPWFVYTPVLHTIREAGTLVSMLDYLDERKLTPIEAALCSQLLILEEGRLPYPRDPQEFIEAIEDDISAAPQVYDFRRRAFRPPVDIQALKVALLPQQYAGTAGALRLVGLGGLLDWHIGSARGDSSTSGSDDSRQWWSCSRRASRRRLA